MTEYEMIVSAGPEVLTGRWFYILRASRQTPARSERRDGASKIIAADYMGSAEFEFGAIPKSLKRYRAEGIKGNLKTFESSVKTGHGKPIWVLCHKAYDEKAVDLRLRQVADGTMRSKEPTHFEVHLNKFAREGHYGLDTTFWMVMNSYNRHDLVMWSVHQDMIKAMLKELSQETPTPGVPEPVVVVDDPLEVKDGTEIALFDIVDVNHKSYTGDAKVLGIFHSTVDLGIEGRPKLRGVKFQDIKRKA